MRTRGLRLVRRLRPAPGWWLVPRPCTSAVSVCLCPADRRRQKMGMFLLGLEGRCRSIFQRLLTPPRSSCICCACIVSVWCAEVQQRRPWQKTSLSLQRTSRSTDVCPSAHVSHRHRRGARCTRLSGTFSRFSSWPQILKWLSNNFEDIPLEVLQDACRQQAEYEARCADHVCAVPLPDVSSMLRLTCAVSWCIADNEASPSSPESPPAKQTENLQEIPSRERGRLLTVVICPTGGHCWKRLARRTALWHRCCPGPIVLPDRMHADHHCHD